MYKIASLLEISLVFTLVLARIWYFDKFGELPALLGILIIVISWTVRGDTLGLWNNDWREAGSIAYLSFKTIFFVLLLALVFNSDFLQTPKLFTNMAWSFTGYLPWALAQQFILNGYFANRLQSIYKSDVLAVGISGVFFAAAHLPNPVLFTACLVCGMASSYFFLKSKNLWPLVIAHALIAVTIMYSLPVSWHHHMRIGPGFFAS